RLGQVRSLWDRASPYVELDRTLRVYAIHATLGRPRDDIPAVADGLQRDAQPFRVTRRGHGAGVVALAGRVEDLDRAAFRIRCLAELDADLRRRLDQARVRRRGGADVVRVRVRDAAQESGAAGPADEDRARPPPPARGTRPA